MTWDKSIKKNIGLDVNVLNNRLSITYDRYWDHITDMLMTLAGQVGVPISVGGAFAEQNYGAIKTWGSEISATWKDRKGDFSYSIGLNFGTSDNRVTKYLPVPFDYPSKIREEKVIPPFSPPGDSWYGRVMKAVTDYCVQMLI